MGFLWVNGFSFFHCVASPFHSFVTMYMCFDGRTYKGISHKDINCHAVRLRRYVECSMMCCLTHLVRPREGCMGAWRL